MIGAFVLAVTDAGQKVYWPEDPVARCWVIFGFGAQAVFTARFLVQWIASERRGKSHIPLAFWYLSLLGAVMLFSFAVWDRSIVIMVGQTTGIAVYVRNLMLLRKEKKQQLVETG